LAAVEIPGRSRAKRWLIAALGGVLLFAIAFFALRAPAVSDALGGLILPEIERATGAKFTLAKASVNLLPLFIEVRRLEGFDHAGRRFLLVPRVKAYVGLSGLLQKEVLLKRIVASGLELSTEKAHFEEVLGNVQAYLAEETTAPIKAVVKSVELRNAAVALSDEAGLASVKGLSGIAVLGNTPRFHISSGTIGLSRPEKPEITFNVKAEARIRDADKVELRSLTLFDQTSKAETSGILDAVNFSGELLTDVRVMMQSLKQALGLSTSGDGMLEAKGKLVIKGPLRSARDIALDLKLKGDFHLEALMETLEVSEDLKGWLSFEGSVEGPLPSVKGEGTAKLTGGRIMGVSVDRLQCRVTYADGTMSFLQAKGSLYGGMAEAEASIHLPTVDYFTLDVRARSVNSSGIFDLIRWDPGIPEGKVDVVLSSSGNAFSPHAVFRYSSRQVGENVLGRVAEVSGSFDLKNGVISFPTLEVGTGLSRVSASGYVDLNEENLSFSGKGATSDLRDFSAPYFEALTGAASFSATLSGPVADPIIEMTVSSDETRLATGLLDLPRLLKEGTVSFSRAQAKASYRKNLLKVASVEAGIPQGTLKFSGAVRFEKADHLFDVRFPDYQLKGDLTIEDLGYLAAFFKNTPAVSGKGQADLALEGKPRDLALSGRVRARDVRVGDGVLCDQIRGKFVLTEEHLDLEGFTLSRAASSLTADARVFMDGRYSFSSWAARLDLGDIAPSRQGDHAALRLVRSLVFEEVSARGEGTLDSPRLEVTGRLSSQNGKARPFGKGDLRAQLADNRLKVTAHLLDDKTNLEGEVTLTEELPWSVSLRLLPGRYDQIVSAVLPEAPEDLILSLKGTIVAQGDRRHMTGSATFESAHVNVFGIGFTNSMPIVLRMSDGQVSVDSLGLRNETSEFTAGGTLFLGRSYNLSFEGTSSLSLFKFLSKNFDLLRGHSAFSISVGGDWAKPQFSGAVDITEGAVGLKTLPYRLTAVKAYLYFDGDRLVLEQASGKVSGGTVNVSGTASLRGLGISKFSVDARVQDVTATVSKDLVTSFDGSLIYKGTREAQMIIGEVNVKKARYTEKMDLPSLILKARQRERPKAEMTRLDETGLNVRVVAPHVAVNNNLIRASLDVDLLIKGTLGQPVPFGKVEAKDGVIYFMGNEYTLTKARIDFTDPRQINPYFDVNGETKVSSYSIRLALSGYVDRFNLSLTSTPSLSESDIFSLLTVGYIGARPAQTEGGSSLTGAGTFLASQLSATMEEQLKTVSGLDRIQVDSYTTRSGTTEPRVSVAKRLWGDRLYVSYGTTLRSTAETGTIQVWKLEYILTKNVSIVGTRDELGGIGADLKFRFEFR